MMTDSTTATTEITTFEEYTLYSLDQSLAGVLGMMERSKMIAACWPEVFAMVGMADLCKEVAALACFQSSLCETLGRIDGDDGECWAGAVLQLREVLRSLENGLEVHDPYFIKTLFGNDLPAALNCFAESIPVLNRHVMALAASGETSMLADAADESE